MLNVGASVQAIRHRNLASLKSHCLRRIWAHQAGRSVSSMLMYADLTRMAWLYNTCSLLLWRFLLSPLFSSKYCRGSQALYERIFSCSNPTLCSFPSVHLLFILIFLSYWQLHTSICPPLHQASQAWRRYLACGVTDGVIVTESHPVCCSFLYI
jgi:hypothetical protein